MSILRRSVHAHRRHKQSWRPTLENLEVRLVPAVSLIAPAAAAGTPAIVEHPAFQRQLNELAYPGGMPTGQTGVWASSFSTSATSGYTPAQVRTAYGVNSIALPNIVANGAGQTIAIVDAYDDPSLVDNSAAGFANSDLARFDAQFGLLNPPTFVKLNEYGSPSNLPGTDPAGAGNPQGNWEVEEALDVEWAHAIAPGANIILIECNSDSSRDMYQGAITAAGLPGVSVVSMSWGASEFSGEQYFNGDFTTPHGHQGVTFVAATGDLGSPGEYPAYSPNVVAVGGTSLNLGANGSYKSETAWGDSGGGISAFEPEPAYQTSVQNTGCRTTPDVSFDANPNTGVVVYDSYNGTSTRPWEQIGGTSLAAPSFAGLVAIADQGRVAAGEGTLDGASQTLAAFYSLLQNDFNDITRGNNGGFTAGVGYDEVTGLGSPNAALLVSDLTSSGLAAKLVVTSEPPGNITAGSSFGLTVVVENSNGAIATSFEGDVTIALANNSGGSALAGNLTVLAQRGVANFSGLSLNHVGVGYTLAVSAGGSAYAVTTPINVTPTAATRLVVISQPPPRVGNNQSFGLTVAVEDAFGNLQDTYSGTVMLVRVGGRSASVLNGTLTVDVAGGVATFSNLSLNRIGAGYSLKAFSGNALAAAKTTSFNVIASEWTPGAKAARLVHFAAQLKPHAAARLKHWRR
jgi:subtilase family serine protease